MTEDGWAVATALRWSRVIHIIGERRLTEEGQKVTVIIRQRSGPPYQRGMDGINSKDTICR